MYVINDVEQLLRFFQAERPLGIFLYEKFQTLISILKQFLRSELLDKNKIPRKFMTIDVNNQNLFNQLHHSILDLGAKMVLNNISTVEATDSQAFYQNPGKLLPHFVKNLLERSLH